MVNFGGFLHSYLYLINVQAIKYYYVFLITSDFFQLPYYVRKVSHKTANGGSLYFNEKGEIPFLMHIANAVKSGANGDYVLRNVGEFDGSLIEEDQLTLNPELITWKGGKVTYTHDFLILTEFNY